MTPIPPIYPERDTDGVRHVNRDKAGRYDDALKRVCACGHEKGEHTAARPLVCLECACINYRRKK